MFLRIAQEHAGTDKVRRLSLTVCTMRPLRSFDDESPGAADFPVAGPRHENAFVSLPFVFVSVSRLREGGHCGIFQGHLIVHQENSIYFAVVYKTVVHIKKRGGRMEPPIGHH